MTGVPHFEPRFAGIVVKCAHCLEDLPARGNKIRAVPRMGGKRRHVHPECAFEIDRQGALPLDGGAGCVRPAVTRRCDLCHAHAATVDLLRNAGALGLICTDQVACSRRQLAARRHRQSDDDLMLQARAFAAVDRAVKRRRSGPRVTFHGPGRAA